VPVFVQRVRSNVKSSDGLLWDVELGEKTLIVGANGRGKSRVVNAVELALTGRASDLAGRADVAREADLLALAPGRRANLFAEATLSTGEKALFAVEYVGDGKARKADHDVPAWFAKQELLPVRAVREAMLGSADTACRQFLKWAGASAQRNLTDMVSPSLHGHLQRLVVLTPGVGVDGLEVAARKKKLEANASVKALEAALTTGGVSQAPPSEEDILTAQEACAGARKVLVAAQASQMRRNAAQRKEQLAQTIGVLEAEAASAEGLYVQWRDHVATLEKPAGNMATAQALLELLAFTLAGGDADCLMCGAQPGVEHLRQRHAAVNAALGAKMKAANDYAGAVASFNAAKTQMESAHTKLAYARHAYNTAIESDEAEAGEVDYTTAAAACDAAETHLRKLQSAQAAWRSYRTLMTQLDTARTDAASWKALEDALAQAGRLLLTDALSAFTGKVQSFLPSTDTFGMSLSEGAREVFHAGFDRGGALHTALSGAEWARLTLAMSAAILPPDAALAVLTPEERAFDPKTLAAVMRALSSAPGQVILTSPIPPHGKTPAGWTVVEL